MNSSRNRKIGYLLGIVVLFTLIIFTSRLIEARAEKYELTQKSLGQVDPVSGTAQLVLVGLRGVAVTFLWHEAIELKKKQRWFEIEPVLKSITLLQPNFIEPWTFQAWNMAYNIAAEWEAVADKYYWMRQGIDFMKDATKKNQDLCDLEWYVGWLYHNRFGMSDERHFLRQLFEEENDEKFAGVQPSSAPRLPNVRILGHDNFISAYGWFEKANQTILEKQKAPKGKGITPFMCYPAHAISKYADFLGQDGIFSERYQNAWRSARDEWIRFGKRGDSKGRYDFIHRLQFDEQEWKELTDEQQFWRDHFAGIVNYDYWRLRARIEATSRMQRAREAFYNAQKARDEGNYNRAIAEYEKAFGPWRRVLEAEEILRKDLDFVEVSLEHESNYLHLLVRLDRPAPKQRPLEGLFPKSDEEMIRLLRLIPDPPDRP